MDKLTPMEKEYLLKKQKEKKKSIKPAGELFEEEMKNEVKDLRLPTEGMLIAARERLKQVDKGYTPEHDYNNNQPGTLILAAQGILHFDIHRRIDSKPNGWYQDLWNKYCIKTEKERLAIASAWLMGELDRYDYHDKNAAIDG